MKVISANLRVNSSVTSAVIFLTAKTAKIAENDAKEYISYETSPNHLFSRC